jgi:hypothetical protein
MPIDKGKLTKKPVELVVEWEGETCRIVYNRRAITYNSMKEAAESTRQGAEDSPLDEGVRNVGFLVKQLKRFLLEWDLTDNGKPVKITEEELGGFDPEFLSALFDAIMSDIRGDPNLPRPDGSDGSTSLITEPAAA